MGNCPLPRLTTGGYPNLASPIVPCPTRYPPSCLFRMELRHQSRSHLCWSLRRLAILADSVLSYAIPSSNQTYLGKLPTDRWFSWFDGTSMENIMGYTISNSWEIPKIGGPKGGKIIAQWGNFPLPCLSIAGQPGFAEYVLRWFPIAWPTRAVCKSKISWDLLGGNKACERRMWWGLSLENLMIGFVQEFGGYPECNVIHGGILKRKTMMNRQIFGFPGSPCSDKCSWSKEKRRPWIVLENIGGGVL